MNEAAGERTGEPETRTRVASTAPIAIDVQTLFRGSPEVRLIHREAEYRLRITRQGKLILTK